MSYHPDLKVDAMISTLIQERDQARAERDAAVAERDGAYGKGVTAGKMEALHYSPDEREAYGKHVAAAEHYTTLRASLAAARADGEMLDWLEQFAEQPNYFTKVSFSNAQDMGYKKDFVSFSVYGKPRTGSGQREFKGKGDSLRAAITAAMKGKI